MGTNKEKLRFFFSETEEICIFNIIYKSLYLYIIYILLKHSSIRILYNRFDPCGIYI